jgi:uncharacterized coiled-coil protein SlyX
MLETYRMMVSVLLARTAELEAKCARQESAIRRMLGQHEE